MEDWMERRGWRKLKLVCHLTDLLQDLVGAIILETQLVVGARHQRSLNIGLKMQVDEITSLERALGASLVGLSLHPLLCPQQMLAHRGKHGGTLSQHCLHIQYRVGRNVSYTEMTRRTPIEYQERGLAQS
jgi:hypothetical protein